MGGERRFHVLDVFTDRALAGNPVAVVLDADDLAVPEMQAIAREFNLSETVFVLPAANAAHSARIRIFTPGAELPFAGHPTIGTAICLAQERFGSEAAADALIVLEEAVGSVRCGVKLADGSGFAEFDCPKLPERMGDGEPKELIAAAIGIAPAEIGFENHTPSRWSAGLPFDFVPVRNRGVLAEAAPDAAAWKPAFGTRGAYVYTRETEGHDHAFRARMFAPTLGINEDPATGSAAAALAGVVQAFDAPPDGEHAFIIEQGFDMGRPSLVHLRLTVAGGRLEAVRIGGMAVPVMTGVLKV